PDRGRRPVYCTVPVVVEDEPTAKAGHGRRRVARKHPGDEVPCRASSQRSQRSVDIERCLLLGLLTALEGCAPLLVIATAVAACGTSRLRRVPAQPARKSLLPGISSKRWWPSSER